MDLKQWFERYTALDANELCLNSSPVKAVQNDELDPNIVEQRIQHSAPVSIIGKRFCIKCQELFDDWPTLGDSSNRQHDSKPHPHEKGWEHTAARSISTFELEASTRAGCRFCTFMLQNLKDCKLLQVFRKVETRLYQLGEDSALSLSIQNWGTNPLQLLWLNFPGKVCTSCNSGIAAEGKFNSTFLPALADCYDDPLDALDIARNWLSTCSESHELCKVRDDSILPTRLISIASESPRLVLNSDIAKGQRYATLSHSWGAQKDVIKLTRQTLDFFLKEIPLDRLPKTFTEALVITKRLGLDFIWIDTLCIIQDDEEDWQTESALMTSVYGGSTCTIAASSARNPTEGCFVTTPYFSGGLRTRVTDDGRQRVQDFRQQQVYELSTFETHLGTRAWALQEKMLAPRTIHFGERGAFWECKTLIASEHLPEGFPRQLVSPIVRREGKFEWHWPQIVQLYSAANLTFGKDKLPALSGIARLGYNETGDQYLAGLWRNNLESQLCWRLWDVQPLERPTFRAPAWSWASIDGKVIWHRTQPGILDTKHIRIFDSNTGKYGKNPFGQVTSGFIRLACSALATGLVHLIPDVQEAARVSLVIGNKEEFCIQRDCIDEVEENDRIHLLPIMSGSTGCARIGKDGNRISEWMVEGIVLRAAGDTKGEFTRVGSFNFFKNKVNFPDKPPNTEEAYEPFLKVLKEDGAVMAEEACSGISLASDDTAQRYVITLV